MNPEDLSVGAWVLDIADIPKEAAHAVREIVRHPDYPRVTMRGECYLKDLDDIALLLLERPVTGLAPVPILPLKQAKERLHPGDPVWISGYGEQCNGEDTLVEMLMIARTPLLKPNETEFVVGGLENPAACLGDSGGPAYLKEGDQVSLVGSASRILKEWVKDCGGTIYTLLPAYADWIRDHAEGAYSPSWRREEKALPVVFR